MQNIMTQRDFCFKCNRPQTSCMCEYITPIETNTKFVIIMHPKEHRKIKNGTGKFTHLSLKNSEIIIGIDFTNHKRVNELIKNYNCYVLYPDEKAIKLNTQTLSTKKDNLLFIIDSTWPLSRRILKESKNLALLPKVSFESTRESDFKIKTQPKKYCLSTIESTKEIISLLNNHSLENVNEDNLKLFIKPFEKMVEYQVECAKKCEVRIR